MACIVYGVAGEGMGHATRTKAVLEHLRNHEVHIVTGSRSYAYFKTRTKNSHRIFGLHIVYWNNCVSNLGILLYNLGRLPLLAYSFLKTLFLVVQLKPRIIVTDYEPFTAYAGLLLGIPVISIGNHHFLNRTQVQYPKKYWWEAIKTKAVNRFLVPCAQKYLITSFSQLVSASARTIILPPILRNEF